METKEITKTEIKSLIKSISNVGVIKNDDYGIIPQNENTIKVNVDFNTIGKLTKFYAKAKSKASLTNFSGDIYNNKSYIVIEKDNYEIIINAPKKDNGDTNWYDYRWNGITDNDKFKTFAPIIIKLK